VLASVKRQTVAPDEIVIADDGSGLPTRDVITSFIGNSDTPARVVSQPHEGFRVTRLRNLAIAATTSEYLIFIDGDMLLHPEFIADHTRFRRPGFYTQGVRAHADEEATARLIADPTRQPGISSRGFGGLRRAYLLHSPAASSLTRHLANAFIAVKACNQGVWRIDLVRINGYNEAIQGWGAEDKELAARLENSGVRRQTLLFGGIASHLHHPSESRAALPQNLALLDKTRRDKLTRCDKGLDAHFGR